MAWKRGTDLTPEDRARVMAKFAHHRGATPAGQWLADTNFRVNGKGRLDRRARHCYTVQRDGFFPFLEAAQ